MSANLLKIKCQMSEDQENYLKNEYKVDKFACYRVYPVMEKSWKSHGIPFFSRPRKVMEIDSRFWKIHKKSWKLKGILAKWHCSCLSSGISIQGYVYVIRSNFFYVSTSSIIALCSSRLQIIQVWPITSSLVASVRVSFHATKHVKGP